MVGGFSSWVALFRIEILVPAGLTIHCLPLNGTKREGGGRGPGVAVGMYGVEEVRELGPPNWTDGSE